MIRYCVRSRSIRLGVLYNVRLRSFSSIESSSYFVADNSNDNLYDTQQQSKLSLQQYHDHTKHKRQRQSEQLHTRKHTYVVAMSGGVDSSVAAAMLVNDHYNNAKCEDKSNIKNHTKVVGIHMSNWNRYDDDVDSTSKKSSTNGSLTRKSSSHSSNCTSSQDFYDAKHVANDILHMPDGLQQFNDEQSYWIYVFEPYVKALIQYGYMGNPDIDCNTYVKFRSLLHHCIQRYSNNKNKSSSCTLVTGHYARLWHRNSDEASSTTPSLLQSSHRRQYQQHLPKVPECIEEVVSNHPELISTLDWLRIWGRTACAPSNVLTPLLMSARDLCKDQSYFLSGVDAKAFHHVYFPLGEYYKTEGNRTTTKISPKLTVREMAKLYQLKPVEKKRDSTGLCFVGNHKHNKTSTSTTTGISSTSGYNNFISNYLPLPQKYLQYINIETNDVTYETIQKQHAVLYTPGQGMKVPGAKEKFFCVSNNYTYQNYLDLLNLATKSTNETNKLYHPITICPGTNHPALYSDCIYVDSIHWLCTVPPPQFQTTALSATGASLNLDGIQCRTRHLNPLTNCTIQIPASYNYKSSSMSSSFQQQQYQSFRTTDEEQSFNQRCRIAIQCHNPIRGITIGQRVVFYTMNGLICLGSAIIVSKSLSYYELYKSI